MKNSYLNDINNFPEETKKEFLLVLKKNLNDFFINIETAVQQNNTEAISQLVHKAMPTLIMLELNSAQEFFNNLKKQEISLNNLPQLLLTIANEKQKIILSGWM